jgi:Family of unknown function (DUF6291)
MATNKTSFVLYSDNKSIIDLMTNEQAGLLLKTLFAYVNDENPIIDESIKLVFEMIKLQLKRDLKKWENTVSERSISGRKGNLKKYNLDLFNLFEQGKYTLDQAENIAKSRKTSHSVANVAVSDSVNVSVSVSDSDNVINKKRLNKFNPPSLSEVENYFFENGYKKEAGAKAFKYYETGDWKDSAGKQVKNWKQKMQAVWFKDENKANIKSQNNLIKGIL